LLQKLTLLLLPGWTREGLPYQVGEALQDALGLNSRELAELTGMSERTLANRKRSGSFTASESDHLIRITRVYTRTLEFFGSAPQAVIWLKQPALALDDRTPLSLLDTEVGADAVLRLLGQLEYGVLP
jgi:putative toxin-antitoxin system antitoxin component (TIGR02293 family)